MGADADRYLVPAEQVLELADLFATTAENCYADISGLNSTANDNLDKNLTTSAHEAFNDILWGMWYKKLLQLAQGLAAMGIMAERLVVATMLQDDRAGQAFTQDPNETRDINTEISKIQRHEAEFEKKLHGQ